MRSLALACAVAGFACAPSVETGLPLADPEAVSAGARARSSADRPMRVDFRWEYGDEKGTIRGDGVGRVNPPDRFRLDFFTAGEGSMAAALVDDSLSTLGQIEDVTLPAPPLLYAMAGVFRPGSRAAARGFESDGAQVLVYEVPEAPTRLFFLREGRLERVEERQGGRVQRRILLEWEEGLEWPRAAEYRDNVTPSRARWEVVEVRDSPEAFPERIYDLGAPPD